MIAIKYHHTTIVNICLCILLLSAILSCKSSKQNATPKQPKNERTPIEVDEKSLQNDCIMVDAMTQRQIGNEERAMALYRKLIAANPTYSAAYYEISVLMIEQGQIDSALVMSKKAVELDNDNIWYLLQLTDVYDALNNKKNEALVWETIVKQHPDVLDYYYSLSECYLQNGEIEKSIEVLNRIEKKYGVSETISIQKKKIWESAGRNDKALEEIEKLANAMPQETRYNAMMAEVYMQKKDYKKAKAYYDQILANHPDDEYIHLSLANYYLQTNDWDNGYKHLCKGISTPALECHEKLSLITNFFSGEAFYYSHTKESMALMSDLRKLCPDDADIALCYGDLLMRQEQYEEAAKMIGESLQTDSSRYEAWEALLICLNAMPNSDDEMIQDYAQRAAKLFPLHILPHYLQALYSLQKDDYTTALKLLQRCERIGFRRGYLEQQTYEMMADCYYHTEEYDKAWKYFDKSLAVDSKSISTLNNYAYFLAEQNIRLEKAEEMSRRTIAAEPDNATYLDTYAWILHKMGRDKEAIIYIERALKNDTDDNKTLIEHKKAIQDSIQ